jgi:hypothetical protein
MPKMPAMVTLADIETARRTISIADALLGIESGVERSRRGGGDVVPEELRNEDDRRDQRRRRR